MNERDRNVDVAASTRKWMWVGLVFMAMFIAVFPIYRIYEPAQRAEARENQDEYLAAAGHAIFTSQCESCHGPQGLGALAPAIGSRDFLESVDDEQLSQLIALGMPGTQMVSYSSDYGGTMTSTDIGSVTAYLRSLEEESVANAIWRTPLADSNLSGKDLYGLACAQCHGLDRMGLEDVAPDISATSFTMEESDEWLAARIRDGRKEMPRFGGTLTDNQINQIVLFLRGGIPETTPTTTIFESGTTTTSQPTIDDAETLAQGKLIFDVTAGGVGCAKCHAFDAQGTSDGPNIIGSSKSAISGALGGGILDMEDIRLTPDELEAVYKYLVVLSMR